ncbi:Crp/Fnr family transcriptional regulator [Gammaproteobacteria bacterium]|nr:Crp/Fnr family transcriptional regulator [Gammaproteobacteria bacterium]
MGSTKRRLDKITNELDSENLSTLLAFAEFLHARQPDIAVEVSNPAIVPRPENESVIGAIRRLSRGYPMLARDTLLNEAVSLMTRHIMSGESAVETIDRLEALFSSRYQAFQSDQSS